MKDMRRSLRRYGGETILSNSTLKVLALIMMGHKAGRPPSIKEMVERCGWHSPQAVQKHIAKLKKCGLVAFEPMKKRTIVPTCRFIPADLLALGALGDKLEKPDSIDALDSL